MSWLARIFGIHTGEAAAPAATATATDAPAEIPPERQGLNGEYDQSGLAKRVVKAFDDAGIADAPHLYVAQTGTTVVFKGNVHSQEIVDQLAQIARGVEGASAVDTSQVHVV
jgi:osmotically-inducible protein OsmY